MVVADLRSGEVRGDLETALGGPLDAVTEDEGGGDASGSGSDSDDSDGGGAAAAWPLRNARWRGAARCTAAGQCNALAFWVDCSLGGDDWCGATSCALGCFPPA